MYDTSCSLQNLENDFWPDYNFESDLIRKCHELRKKPINDYSVEDLRLMIGQSIGLNYLIPVALEILDEDILSGGDFYEGDLLLSVLKSDAKYWSEHRNEYKKMDDIFDRHRGILREFKTLKKIKNDWFVAYQKFRSI